MTIRNSLPFAMIPEWLLDSDVSAQATRLYCVLHRYADKDTQDARPIESALAKRLGCSLDTIDRALKELVQIGAVDVEHRLDEAGDLTSNDYILRPGGRTDAATRDRTDAATVAAPMRHRTKAIEREPSEREKVLAPRKRDAIWDVLVEMYGEPTDASKKLRGLNAKVLRDYGADADEVRAFVAIMAGTDRDWAVTTPSALAKHYGERRALMAQVQNGRKKHDHAAQLLREAMNE